MLGILGLFLRAAAGHILYLALHLESGSFPRPLSPDQERAAFAQLRGGGAGAARARDLLIRHNLRLVAHICKKYYAGTAAQDDLISIGTIGLIKAVDTFDPDKGKRFSSYASRCIENELRMELRRVRKAGVQVSLQEPLEAGGQLTLADTLPDDAEMEADCEQRGRRCPAARAGGRPAAPGTGGHADAVRLWGRAAHPAADGASAGHQPQLCIAPPLM